MKKGPTDLEAESEADRQKLQDRETMILGTKRAPPRPGFSETGIWNRCPGWIPTVNHVPLAGLITKASLS